MTSEKVAEIRNILETIEEATRTPDYHYPDEIEDSMEIIRKSVEKVDKLLPDVKFEGGK